MTFWLVSQSQSTHYKSKYQLNCPTCYTKYVVDLFVILEHTLLTLKFLGLVFPFRIEIN